MSIRNVCLIISVIIVLVVRWNPVVIRMSLSRIAACLIKNTSASSDTCSPLVPGWNLHHLHWLRLLKSYRARMDLHMVIVFVKRCLRDIFHHVEVHFVETVSTCSASSYCINKFVFLIWSETQTLRRPVVVVISHVTEIVLKVATLVSWLGQSLAIIEVINITTARGRQSWGGFERSNFKFDYFWIVRMPNKTCCRFLFHLYLLYYMLYHNCWSISIRVKYAH